MSRTAAAFSLDTNKGLVSRDMASKSPVLKPNKQQGSMVLVAPCKDSSRCIQRVMAPFFSFTSAKAGKAFVGLTVYNLSRVPRSAGQSGRRLEQKYSTYLINNWQDRNSAMRLNKKVISNIDSNNAPGNTFEKSNSSPLTV